jgi:hypothetical protein
VTQHPGLMTSRDLLAKLERELGRLETEVSADTYFNFVMTAYHLCDWIKNDPRVPVAAKTALPAFRKLLPIRVCRDIANGSKHFTLTYSNVIVADATCVVAYGTGRFGHGAFGTGESEIQVTLSDTSKADGLLIARQATALWQGFHDPRHLVNQRAA